MERFTDKMSRVKENLVLMASMNAPESDVQSYLDTEGTTWAQLRQFDAIEQSDKPEKPGALVRFGRGMTDIATGAGQITGTLPTMQAGLSALPGGMPITSAGDLYGRTDQQANAAELADVQQYESAQGPGVDWWRLGGQAVATAPLGAPAGMMGKAGLLGRTAMGAGAGGASGLITYAKDAGERAQNVVGGAVGGGLFAAVAPAATRLGGKVVAKAGDVLDTVSAYLKALKKGDFAVEVSNGIVDASRTTGISLDDIGAAYRKRIADKAANALKKGDPFDYPSALRQARAETFGFTDDAAMTRGQATRNPMVFSEEMNLSKRSSGAALADRYNRQLAQAESVMDDLAKQPDLDPVTFGESLRGYSKAQADAMQGEVRLFYDAVPKGGTFSREALANRTSQIMADFRDNVSSGVKQRIGEIIDPASSRAFTADELISLDKLISETMPPDPTNAARGTAAGRLKEAILGVMDDAADTAEEGQKDAYLAAKAAAKKRFDAIGPHNGLVSQLVHGGLDPTQVANRVTSGKIEDLRRLKSFIPEDKWPIIQRATENRILESARGNANGQFSQSAYNKIINKIGKARLTEIFGEKQAKELLDFNQVARELFAYPNFHTVNTSNSAPELANIAGDVMGGLLDLAPGGRLAGALLERGGKDAAARKAERQTMKIVAGLLANQPSRVMRQNPALPLLPGVAALSPAAGLLTNQKLGE